MKLVWSLVIGFFGLLPESLAFFLARFWGSLWFYAIPYRKKVIFENLSTAFPDLSRTEKRELARKFCVHLVYTLIEFFRIPRYARRGFKNFVRTEGLENYYKAKEEHRGVLCLAGHLGSFELIIAAMADELQPEWVGAVVKSFPKNIAVLVDRIRKATPFHLIPAKGGMKSIQEALDQNGAVVFVLDQNATRKLGVFVDFFGKPACTMTGLATVALRTGAPVIAASAYREAPGKHVLKVFPPIPLEEKGDVHETIAHMTAVYTRFLEKEIKEHPEQWLWSHKRWRTQRPV